MNRRRISNQILQRIYNENFISKITKTVLPCGGQTRAPDYSLFWSRKFSHSIIAHLASASEVGRIRRDELHNRTRLARDVSSLILARGTSQQREMPRLIESPIGNQSIRELWRVIRKIWILDEKFSSETFSCCSVSKMLLEKCHFILFDCIHHMLIQSHSPLVSSPFWQPTGFQNQ